MTRIDTDQFHDPRWRLSNLYTITNKAGQSVPFQPNTAQLALLDELHSAEHHPESSPSLASLRSAA